MDSDPLSKPTFWDLLPGGSPVTEVGLQLFAFREERYDPMGSAVVIGTNLALTALHVVRDYWQQFEGCSLDQRLEGTFHLSAIQRLSDGEKAILYDVTAFSYLPELGDLVVLKLQPASSIPPKFQWMVPKISLLPPPIGSVVHAFGYRDARAALTAEGPTLTQRPTTSTGRVQEVFLQGRDKLLPFPCFRCNARFDGGMSGGPVFDHMGSLVGIICNNLPPYEENEEHVSHVTLLWPLMGLTLNFPRLGFPPDAQYTVLDLARGGFIFVKGWEQITLVRNEESEVTKVEMRLPNRA